MGRTAVIGYTDLERNGLCRSTNTLDIGRVKTAVSFASAKLWGNGRTHRW
ncbi:MAG: hypothetical protein M5U34_21275 [Chloroflexi bacterium]|nr:hypothetical protein [Chloroflexota bacterium]